MISLAVVNIGLIKILYVVFALCISLPILTVYVVYSVFFLPFSPVCQ